MCTFHRGEDMGLCTEVASGDAPGSWDGHWWQDALSQLALQSSQGPCQSIPLPDRCFQGVGNTVPAVPREGHPWERSQCQLGPAGGFFLPQVTSMRK